MKIAAPSKKLKSKKLRFSGASSGRTVQTSHYLAKFSGACDDPSSALASSGLIGAALPGTVRDRSVTTNNRKLNQILEQKIHLLIEERNAVIDMPDFAGDIEASAEAFEASDHASEPDGLAIIDKKLDELERHLDGHEHLAQRFVRTKNLLAALDREFVEYRRLLEVDG